MIMSVSQSCNGKASNFKISKLFTSLSLFLLNQQKGFTWIKVYQDSISTIHSDSRAHTTEKQCIFDSSLLTAPYWRHDCQDNTYLTMTYRPPRHLIPMARPPIFAARKTLFFIVSNQISGTHLQDPFNDTSSSSTLSIFKRETPRYFVLILAFKEVRDLWLTDSLLLFFLKFSMQSDLTALHVKKIVKIC